MPGIPITQQAEATVEWVQALAEVHAKFIEEATDALVKTAGEAASDVPVAGMRSGTACRASGIGAG